VSGTSAIERIEKGLAKLLQAGNRIVWWSDPDGEFADAVADLSLGGADVVSLGDTPALAVKRQVELASPASSFVLYEGQQAPDPEQDWLLDIRLYAEPFAADATSMLQQDLGLQHASLRHYLKDRARFFASKDRTARLASLLHADDMERDIDAKIWAVLSRSGSADPFTLLLDLLCDVAQLDEGVAFDDSPLWQNLVKYGLEPFAWALLERHFGYRDDAPSLARFIPRLLVTDLGRGLKKPLPTGLIKLALPQAKAGNVAVLLSQWRDSTARQKDYDGLSARLSSDLQLAHHLSNLTPADVANCATFVDLERIVANALRDQLLGNMASSVMADVRRTVNSRLASYWVSDRYPDTEVGKRSIWRGYYQALLSATDLFEAIETRAQHFGFTSPEQAYSAYTESLFEIDQFYRLFHESADVVSARFPDAIAPLADQVEAAYLNRYLNKLAAHWDGHLQNGLLEKWKLEGVVNQQSFYQKVVAPYLAKGDERRMFVIISDALRYEVADELKTQINGRERIDATLRSQLGVLPSYTKLGMASLLPHKTLTYNAKGSVDVDGRSSEGLDNRNKILGAVGGTAVKAETLANMGKQALREFVRPHRVIYIYHNTIDAVGDSASTESSTWIACRQAINELADLVSRLVNNASATAITVTADHGFLFRETAPDALEKSAMASKPAGTITAKKRYLVGNDLGEAEYAHHGKTAITAGTGCDTEFWLPRGVGRFHFVGGARFVHGGAALQEVAVPIIEIRQKYGKSAESTRVSKVGVNVLGQQHRITTNYHVFTLLQTEPVSEKVLATTITIELVNQHGDSVSSRELLNLDSDAAELGERQSKVSLSLAAQAVKPGNDHFLVLSDAESEIELQRIPVRIDLAIENDFDF